MKVQRYGRNNSAHLEPMADGRWVEYEDYAKLKAEYERLKIAGEKIAEAYYLLTYNEGKQS